MERYVKQLDREMPEDQQKLSLTHFPSIFLFKEMATGVLLFLLSLYINSAYGEECTVQGLDVCGESIMRLFIKPEVFPSNEEQMETSCKDMNNGISCFNNFLKRCPTLIPGQLSNAFVETITANIGDICKKGSALYKKVLKHGPCIRETLGKNHTCTPDFIRHVEAARIQEDIEKRLPSVCCGMAVFDKCYYAEVSNACHIEAARTNRRVVQGFAIFLAEKCLSFLANPKKCSEYPALPFHGDLQVKTILPGITSVLL